MIGYSVAACRIISAALGLKLANPRHDKTRRGCKPGGSRSVLGFLHKPRSRGRRKEVYDSAGETLVRLFCQAPWPLTSAQGRFPTCRTHTPTETAA